jgi:regulator of sirC expression with transglutaminase-like and TPR domain
VKRRALLQLVCLAGCSRVKRTSENPCAAWLRVGQEYGEFGAGEVASAARELERLSGLVQKQLRACGDIAEAVRHVVFRQSGFVREVDDASLRFVLLPSVLRQRRGNCVGLGSLLVALMQLAGSDANGVLRPGHFHARLQHAGRVRNLEPLRGGEEMPAAWYDVRFPAIGQAEYYGRPLSSNEVLGVLEYDIGNQRKREQRLSAARRAYTSAARHFPDFAEAHASLGTVLHVQGELQAAERAYRLALQKNPALPGLQWNLELLLAEAAKRRAR